MKLYIILCFIMILINEILGRVKVRSKNKLKKTKQTCKNKYVRNVKLNYQECLKSHGKFYYYPFSDSSVCCVPLIEVKKRNY